MYETSQLSIIWKAFKKITLFHDQVPYQDFLNVNDIIQSCSEVAHEDIILALETLVWQNGDGNFPGEFKFTVSHDLMFGKNAYVLFSLKECSTGGVFSKSTFSDIPLIPFLIKSKSIIYIKFTYIWNALHKKE